MCHFLQTWKKHFFHFFETCVRYKNLLENVGFSVFLVFFCKSCKKMCFFEMHKIAFLRLGRVRKCVSFCMQNLHFFASFFVKKSRFWIDFVISKHPRKRGFALFFRKKTCCEINSQNIAKFINFGCVKMVYYYIIIYAKMMIFDVFWHPDDMSIWHFYNIHFDKICMKSIFPFFHFYQNPKMSKCDSMLCAYFCKLIFKFFWQFWSNLVPKP